jgi:hypothetical protein
MGMLAPSRPAQAGRCLDSINFTIRNEHFLLRLLEKLQYSLSTSARSGTPVLVLCSVGSTSAGKDMRAQRTQPILLLDDTSRP